MATQQSSLVLQIIDFVNEIRNNKDLLSFLHQVKDREELSLGNSGFLPKRPCLSLLSELFYAHAGNSIGEFNNANSPFTVDMLESVAQRANELATNEAVLDNLGSALLVNPVALAVLAQNKISVSIIHSAQSYLDEPDDHEPQVYYITDDFLI